MNKKRLTKKLILVWTGESGGIILHAAENILYDERHISLRKNQKF